MSGFIGTGNHPKALWPGVKTWFGNSYESFTPQWRELANDVETSTQNYEEVVQDTGFVTAPIKAQGTGIAYDANVQGYTTRATHVTYALGYAVTMEELQDNLYEKVSMARSKALAFSHAQAREIVTANVLNNGFSSALQVIGDGQAFFSTAHPFTSGGTFANKSTVDADLSEASLEDALILIRGFTTDKGQPIRVQPKKLIVARQNEYNAARILKSVLQNDTGNNAINAIKATGALPEGYMVCDYLTDTNAWFVKNAIPMGSGFMFYDRMPVTFDKDNDFNTKSALASAVQRFSVAVADPRCYFGSSGSS